MSINKALVTDLRKAEEQVAELEAENQRLREALRVAQDALGGECYVPRLWEQCEAYRAVTAALQGALLEDREG